ncbi:hypothetical protein JXA40_04730 [bacterium]|nr:hypothetical protein [candidate division CSSED10-310 bacterium]
MGITWRNISVAGFIGIILISFSASVSLAREVFVENDETIQGAIDMVEDGDIVTVRDGVYTGWNNTDLDFSGKRITVRSENGPFRCIIDCNNSGCGFHFDSGEKGDSIVQGFTIRYGNAFRGGAIYCKTSSPTIQNCVFSQNNSSNMGGAVYCLFDASPNIFNCLFEDNTAEYGGAIHCDLYAGPEIANCTFSGNRARAEGGALFVSNFANPSISNGILWGNLPEEINGPSPATVTYSDVQGGYPGSGNLDADPLLTAGSMGGYYLSQVSAGQPDDSPCLDAGSDPAGTICMKWSWGDVCLDDLTTRTDHQTDGSAADMGFHYAPPGFATPTPTPFVIPSPTPTATPSIMPTFTITATPTTTPTITPTPTPEFRTVITMPDDFFTPGETCWVKLDFHNHLSTVLWNMPVFVALDIYGQFWFWPEWSPEIVYREESIPEGASGLSIIESFSWPDIKLQSMNGLKFWGCVTDPDFITVWGGEDGLSFWEFGFGPL